MSMQIDFACERIHRRVAQRSTRGIRRQNCPRSCGEASTRILRRSVRMMLGWNARAEPITDGSFCGLHRATER